MLEEKTESKKTSKKAERKEKPSKSEMTALKDFRILHNEHDIVIHKGDDLSGVPEKFVPNLITEGVLKK